MIVRTKALVAVISNPSIGLYGDPFPTPIILLEYQTSTTSNTFKLASSLTHILSYS